MDIAQKSAIRTLFVHPTRMDEFIARVARLTARAEKLGCESPRILDIDLKNNLVEFLQPEIRISGWKFSALLDFSHSSPVVIFGELPDGFRSVGNDCEHCHSHRGRPRTRGIVVQHDDGRVLQVGTSCVADFLGHKISVPGIIKLFEEYEDFDFSRLSSDCWNLDEILPTVAACIRKYGYVSRSRRDDRTPTADLIQFDFDSIPDRTDQEINEAKSAIEWAQNLEPRNDFERSMKTIAEDGYATKRTLGIACYIVPAYLRKIAEENTKKSTNNCEKKPIEEGKKINVCGSILSMKEVENAYGFSLKILVQDEHERKYWSTVPAKFSGTIGDSISIVGTVTRSKRDQYFGFVSRPRMTK